MLYVKESYLIFLLGLAIPADWRKSHFHLAAGILSAEKIHCIRSSYHKCRDDRWIAPSSPLPQGHVLCRAHSPGPEPPRVPNAEQLMQAAGRISSRWTQGPEMALYIQKLFLIKGKDLHWCLIMQAGCDVRLLAFSYYCDDLGTAVC